MNCGRVQKLLPLFVGRDLQDRRAQQVAVHLENCALCARAADEYRETRQMLQQFSSPAFSEGVYAAMRQRVLREIEADSGSSISSRFVAGLLWPRLSWAVATMLLIALALSAIYLIANRTDRRQLVVGHPDASHEQTGTQPAHEPQAPLPSPLNDGHKRPRPAFSRRRNYRNVIGDSPGSVAMSARTTSSAVSDGSLKLNSSAESTAPSDGDSEKTLRMELQTKDPNIRIIWFYRPDTTRVSPN